MLQDRDDPTHYFTVVEFPSFEDAMKNSELPETQELSQKLGGAHRRRADVPQPRHRARRGGLIPA